jgi:trimethylamine---corrinoid protein Co-methyltransferase
MNQADAEQIHETSLRILERTGVRMEHDAIVARLLKAGARPGLNPHDVKLPAPMVREYMALAPPVVELCGVDGTPAGLQARGPSFYWTCPVLRFWDGTQCREVTSADLSAIGRVSNHLENIQGVMGVAMTDVPPRCRDFVGVRVLAENTRKHVRALCFSGRGMDALAEMKALLPGNWLSVGFTAHGPLRWTHLALDVFLRSAGHAIPTTINGEPMAGVTAPVTPAGAMSVGNAEILAGIVVNQVLEPGRPVIYNLGLGHVFDMKHATAVTGGPENAFFAEASAALGRFYNLPSSSWVSTESLFEDEQAAMEKTLGYLTHSSAGVSLIWGVGQLESEMTLSLAQLVIDNEVLNYLGRYREGFAVNQETLACGVIEQAGIGGSYLESDHTLENFRSNLYHPRILNRKARHAGSEPIERVAAREVEDILKRSDAPGLPPQISAELRRIEARYLEEA